MYFILFGCNIRLQSKKGSDIISRRNGNRKAQVKRYKAMKKQVPRAPDEKELIDGNFSHYCTGWCERKQGYLTLGLERTHRCKERKCERYYKVL